MSDLRDSELRRLDLTLLLVFLGLVRHRKAAMIASELGLTPSAISQALKRLREVFRDPLFLRRPHGMEPTSTALALEEPVRRAVESLRGALGAIRDFEPEAAQGILRITALDAEQSVLVPPLAARLRLSAPGLRLSVLPLGRAAAIDALQDGRADLALGFIWNAPDWLSADMLYEEGFLVVGQPALLEARPMTLERYCAADHVLVSPAGDLRGVVDDRLEALGLSRRIVLGLPAFLPALAAAQASGALVTLPARLARAFAAGFGLVCADPPLDIRRFRVSAFWHRRNDQEPRTRWMRDQLRIIAEGLG